MLKHATIINEISPVELGDIIEKRVEAAIAKLRDEIEQGKILEKEKPDKIFRNKKEAAEYLKISTVSLSKYIKDGFVKGYKFGGRLRFKLSDLDNAMKALRNIAQ